MEAIAELEQLVNVHDFERLAEQRLEAGPLGYFAGGAADERTLRANVAAFERMQLRPRVLVDVADTDPATTVLGAPVSMPLLVAPVAFQGLLHPDGELATARAAAAAGTIFTLSSIAGTGPRQLAELGGRRWMQVYVFRDRAITRAIIDQALDSGFEALAITVDAPRAGRRERDLRTGFHIPPELSVPSLVAAFGADACPTPAEVFAQIDERLSWSDIERFVSDSPVPVLLKGIQTAEDARLACEHGVAGIVVSNHGGRQLDGVAATLEMLPEIAEAADGRLEVLIDGGVRRGTDVLKALALGARAVLAGRAVAWGVAAGGEAGVSRVLALLREELVLGMKLLGTPRVADVTAAHVGH